MDLTKYRKIFSQESIKYLQDLDVLLLQAERQPAERSLWTEIHGKIHSIKGMARALSLERITRLAHAMEDWCKAFQQGSSEAVPQAVQLLLEGAALLRILVDAMDEAPPEAVAAWERLVLRFSGDPPLLAEIPVERKPAACQAERIDFIRVRYPLIEELLGFSQELLFLERELPPLFRHSTALKNWIDHYASMMKGLYFRLSQLRLMSVEDFSALFARSIRDLAREYDRSVRLELAGGELQADIAVLDRLREPLIHLLRNCLAHGIETREEREKKGKNPEGRILLQAETWKERLILRIEDDGKGIDESAIVRFLKRKRLLSDDRISRMPREELFNTILDPEFSSAEETTEMAGRGIGMSVVAQTVEQLGGSMSIASERGKGTRFTIRLPVSLSVIYAVAFRVGPYRLSIPTSIVESIEKKENLSAEDRAGCIDFGGMLGLTPEDGPVYILNIGLSTEKRPDAGTGSEPSSLRLLAHAISGNKAVMVMPVGELLARAGVFSGVGVMENGEIALLLDVERLKAMK